MAWKDDAHQIDPLGRVDHMNIFDCNIVSLVDRQQYRTSETTILCTRQKCISASDSKFFKSAIQRKTSNLQCVVPSLTLAIKRPTSIEHNVLPTKHPKRPLCLERDVERVSLPIRQIRGEFDSPLYNL